MDINITIPDDTANTIQAWLDNVDTIPISIITKPKTVEELVNQIITNNIPCYLNIANQYADNELLKELKANPTSLSDIKAKIELKQQAPNIEPLEN